MKKNHDFVLRELYGKAILMPIRTNDASNNPIYLNDTAVTIWKMVEKDDDRTSLVEKVCELYNLQSNSVEKVAIKNYVRQLIKNKLLVEGE